MSLRKNTQSWQSESFTIPLDWILHNPASCFGHLNFEDLKILSDFDLPAMPLRRFRVVPQSECYCHRHYSLLKYFAWQAGIRISNLFSVRKNTNFTTNGPITVKVFNKDQQVIALMLGLTVLLIGLFRSFHPVGSMLGPSRSNLRSESRHQCIIEVTGAVKKPGIYSFDKPPTASQAIQRTGGPIGERHLSFDSPGDTLNTGMHVEVQESSAECAQVIITPMSYRKRLVLGIPIDLNQASIEDLDMIPGISHGLARRTVEFRESHGPFKTWNDLRRVKGIGPKKVESFRSYLNLK